MPTTVILPKENLYSDGYIVGSSTSDAQLLKRDKVNFYGLNPNDRVHTVVELESIWAIAYEYYGNSKWWHIIADANQIENPFELPIGESLLVPDLNTVLSIR